MAGVRLGEGAKVIWFGAVQAPRDAVVVTVAGSTGALPGTDHGSVKVTPYDAFPAKGRATGGVRCHRLLKGEDTLLLAWAGPYPRALTATGEPLDLPEPTDRRDGSGTPTQGQAASIGGAPAGLEAS